MTHPIEVKAHCIADMLLGNSAKATAKKWGVSYSTVKRWRREEVLPILSTLAPIRVNMSPFMRRFCRALRDNRRRDEAREASERSTKTDPKKTNDNLTVQTG